MAGTCCTTLVEIRCLWKYLIDGQAWVRSLLATLVTEITRLGTATKKVQRELKQAKGTGSIEESKLKEQRKKNLKKSRARSLNLIKSALVMLLGCFSWLLALSHHLSPEAWVSSLPSYYAIRMPVVMLLYGLVGLKTHYKCIMVVRREDDGLRTYVHLGTGKNNPRTASVYTDFGLLREIANTQARKPASIIFKCNGLDDQVMVTVIWSL